MDVITEFESKISGWLTSVVQGKFILNNNCLSTYDPLMLISTWNCFDVNTLHATTLDEKLPGSGFIELSKEEVASFFHNNVLELKGDHNNALVIDSEILDEIKLKTDELPMSFS